MSKRNTYQDTPLGELISQLEQQRQKLADLQVELRLQKTNAHSGVQHAKRDIARILTAIRAGQTAKHKSEVQDV